MGTKMYHPKAEAHLALLSGHTFVVPNDPVNGVSVPQRFHKAALLQGCLFVGMVPEEEDAPGVNRTDIIKEGMRKMLTSEDPAYFTPAGSPSTDVLSRFCGFGIDRGERDSVWKLVTDDLEREAEA